MLRGSISDSVSRWNLPNSSLANNVSRAPFICRSRVSSCGQKCHPVPKVIRIDALNTRYRSSLVGYAQWSQASVGQAQMKAVRQQYRVTEYLEALVGDQPKFRVVQRRRYFTHERFWERQQSRAIMLAGRQEFCVALLRDINDLGLVEHAVANHFLADAIFHPDHPHDAQSIQSQGVEGAQ